MDALLLLIEAQRSFSESSRKSTLEEGERGLLRSL
jgi:hypothetical protein